jgi:hypothetical protein
MMVVASLALMAALDAGASQAQSTESAAAFYSRALGTMKQLAQPKSMRFNVDVRATGVGVQLQEDPKSYASLVVGFGSAFTGQGDWTASYRGESNRSIIERPHNTSLFAVSPIFNPTWLGAYDYLRYGLHGQPLPKLASPVPSATPLDGIKEIAVVSVVNPGAYDVSYAGNATCPSGAPGLHLRLVARTDPRAHPLTDVTVDPNTMRFCSMRFNIGNASGISLTGSFELHFGDRQGYWLVTDASSNLLFRLFGFGTKHAHLDLTYSDVEIPAVASGMDDDTSI